MRYLSYRDAKELATMLRTVGIPTGAIREPGDRFDGIIEITPLVQIQVPLDGHEPNVVRENADGTFDFADQRATMEDLLDDIQLALAGKPFPSDEDG